MDLMLGVSRSGWYVVPSLVTTISPSANNRSPIREKNVAY
ncbi:hypothetical protein TGAMA5MH_04493 [Trichoderma gamsii]|uniref:Uncharacterized protein n=1 Tax=Trichoderma gamsii TaxID=398673 RepID=A0A2K0TDB7_9HYPO|nr:hypothetical protein TGAMA5MH_04493 [Trichoderma gamsii]